MKPRKMLKPAKLAYVAAPRAGHHGTQTRSAGLGAAPQRSDGRANWSSMAVPRKSRMAGLGIELGRHEFQSAMRARV
jgi:hypothetical protein